MKNKLTLSCLLKSGYIRVPRIVFVLYFSGDPQEKLLAGLYLYLYTQSYFKTGSVCKHRKVLPCERGQIICSHADMAKVMGNSKKCIGPLLEELKQLEVIEVELIEGISHIGILYYDSLAGIPSDFKPEPSEQDKQMVQEEETKKAARANPTRISYDNYPLAKFMQDQQKTEQEV